MNDRVATIFVGFLYVLIVLVVIRSLLTWFPISSRNQAVQLLHQVTEPMLEPVRRFMPRTGFIDFSAMVVIVILYIMIYAVRRAAEN
ncbi:MAG: YggT family protein [Tepidiformaceae bacterium]